MSTIYDYSRIVSAADEKYLAALVAIVRQQGNMDFTGAPLSASSICYGLCGLTMRLESDGLVTLSAHNMHLSFVLENGAGAAIRSIRYMRGGPSVLEVWHAHLSRLHSSFAEKLAA